MIEQLAHILYSSSAIKVELSLVIGIILLIFLIIIGKKNKLYRLISWGLTFGIITLAFLLLSYLPNENIPLFNNLLLSNAMSSFGKELICISALLILLHIRIMKYDFEGEFYILLLSIILGLCFLLMSSHFMSLFISIEMVSICSYMLVSLQRKANNLEAGIKYLIFGAASTAIMLFGISYLYGATGTFHFYSDEFREQLLHNENWLIQTALAMTLAGPLFKLSTAPFHIWAPDVYESTASPLISFLAIAPKIGALFVIFRILNFIPYNTNLLIGGLILITILIGNFAALSQKDSKRMLGYSGIAQAGFMMIGLLAISSSGLEASVFYLSAYLFISIGTFFLLDIIHGQTGSFSFKSMAGLSQKNILLGLIAIVFMIALVGLPPTSGFTAKLLVFSSIWEQYADSGSSILLWVLIFGLLNTAVSIYYYFKIPYQMFLKKATKQLKVKAIPATQWIFLSLLAICVLALFFSPGWVQGRLNVISF